MAKGRATKEEGLTCEGRTDIRSLYIKRKNAPGIVSPKGYGKGVGI